MHIITTLMDISVSNFCKPSDIEKIFLDDNYAQWKGHSDDPNSPWPAILCEL